jgi:hypothetical protein
MVNEIIADDEIISCRYCQAFLGSWATTASKFNMIVVDDYMITPQDSDA